MPWCLSTTPLKCTAGVYKTWHMLVRLILAASKAGRVQSVWWLGCELHGRRTLVPGSGNRVFCAPKRPASCEMVTKVWSDWGVKLTSYSHIMPDLKMSGSRPPLLVSLYSMHRSNFTSLGGGNWPTSRTILLSLTKVCPLPIRQGESLASEPVWTCRLEKTRAFAENLTPVFGAGTSNYRLRSSTWFCGSVWFSAYFFILW